MRSLVILATGIGLGSSAAVTYRAHRKPMSPEWDESVGNTRLRRSDLPIGGAVTLAMAFGSLVTGHPKAAAVLAGAGLGATAGSLGVAVLDPRAETDSAADASGADAAAEMPWPPPTAPTSHPAFTPTPAGETAGVTEFTPDTVTMAGLSGAALGTLADADEALGGISTDTADGLAAEARAKASLDEPEQPTENATDPGQGDGHSESAPDWQPPAADDFGDNEDAEQELERAAEAVEHQASYGSPSLDDMQPESLDESDPQALLTGSAPQEGEVAETGSNDQNT